MNHLKLITLLILFLGASNFIHVSAQTVYITKTGEKYHKGTCHYLKQSKYAIDLSEAKTRGYTPCSVCKPPSTINSSSLLASSPSGLSPDSPRLGSRTLKKGMSGTDVTELINLLIAKSYLKLDDGRTAMTGSQAYDAVVEDAIKRFQQDNGLNADGVCGQNTIDYLKNK